MLLCKAGQDPLCAHLEGRELERGAGRLEGDLVQVERAQLLQPGQVHRVALPQAELVQVQLHDLQSHAREHPLKRREQGSGVTLRTASWDCMQAWRLETLQPS